ncbi:uncharacterized protein LOC127871059 [Dreissena polymorpha]|uniref:Uncharacterized protein n=2 Tax=Dreissena polymorpha TaxID=45954 RepID=A0A9D4LBL9_DREPO|nr:uncharacterized protein LOC127871059 [Dreissena polymorpha]KAH3855622.1 hypothetical protein DPMN_098192 [Dreissena polymorpha]
MDFVLFVAVYLSVAVVSISQAQIYAPTFANGTVVARLRSRIIDEASGICASRIHKDVLYTHNDSGDKARIYAISTKTGQRLMTIEIDGASAVDYEDISCGPCDSTSGHCIYVADVGGNSGAVSNTVYKIREPEVDLTHGKGGTFHVPIKSKLEFSWDQHDCETIMVDNKANVYVVSKVNAGQYPKLVRLPHRAWGTKHRVKVDEGVYLSLKATRHDPVGGDISRDGREVLLKTHHHVYYWYVPDGDYYKHMTSQPLQLPYIQEPQGEAVCFDPQATGYYTTSEGRYQPLYYYRRINRSTKSPSS